MMAEQEAVAGLGNEPLPPVNPVLVRTWSAIPAEAPVNITLSRHDWDNVMLNLFETQVALDALSRLVVALGKGVRADVPQEAIDTYAGSLTNGHKRLVRFIETVMARAAEEKRGA